MTKLIFGVLLWSATHFIPSALSGFRQALIERRGEQVYKGVFATLMVVAIYLMIAGWKAAGLQSWYLPHEWGRHAAALLMLASLVLFVAPYPPNNIKRWLRHPQLSGVMVWGVAHLLANGEARSVVLFGGLTLWAILEVMLINRRDGDWTRPPVAPRRYDLLVATIGIGAYVALIMAHRWLFGVSPLPGI